MAQDPVDKRRRELSRVTKTTFEGNKNRCKAFAQVVEAAILVAPTPRDMLEDLRHILIGADWKRRKDKRGPYYVGPFEGSEGFKPELADPSPQVEHAFAAIYLGATYPPGSTELISAATEMTGNPINWADVRLYMVGGDLGQRISRLNYKQVPDVIRRTMCQ
jgi:hypothetical protein